MNQSACFVNSSKNKLPPLASDYKSWLRLRRFIKNPIPFLLKNFDKYGDTFRFNYRWNQANILTRDPDVIDHVLRANAANYEKPTVASSELNQFIGQGLLLTSSEKHKLQRRQIQPAFHHKKVALIFETAEQEMDRFLDELKSKIAIKSEIACHQMMKDLTFRLMCKSIFGEDMNPSIFDVFYKEYHAVKSYFIRMVRFPYFSKLYKITGTQDQQLKRIKKLQQIVREIIRKRQNQPEKSQDLLQMLLDVYPNITENEDQLIHEIFTLFVAGHETAGDASTWSLYLLAKHQEEIEKIRVEQNHIFPFQKISFEQFKEMKQLNQCIAESLRLYPPSWSTDRISKGNDEIKGIVIPKGVRIIPIFYGLHRHPLYWKNPDTFLPARFDLPSTNGKQKNYLPFGAGARMCMGKNYAMMLIQLILIKILQNFDIALVSNQEPTLHTGLTLQPRYDIKMSLISR